ncbi:MAG: HAD family hydrolase [Treponema sp.]|jgi:phosphoglycolate phosphatase|nr:HAD family hydrolase [Treponema sp.]
MKYNCVIFDLDGTLVDTIGDIAESMNKSLVFYGFSPVPREKYPRMVGWGVKKLAWLALAESAGEAVAEEKAEKVAAGAARFYAEAPLVYSKPYSGIPETVAELARKQVKMAVISNKPDPVARLVVEGLFPGNPFRAIRGEIPGLPRKPDPAAVWELLVQMDRTPRETVFVGDSEIDMETARSAGCFALGVGWGYRPRQVIEEAGAGMIIDRPDEIPALIRDTRM